jgi:hypothetical protein
MKGFLRMFAVGWLFVAAAPVPPAVAGEPDPGGEFTFEDVFSTRHQDEVFRLHGYAAFQYFDSEGTPPGGNQSFDQHIFEPFFGYQVNEQVFTKIILEFEHSPERVDDDQFAEIFIEQAEIDLTPWPGTTVAFGAILVPFGLENYFHAPSDNRLITRPPLVKSGANGNPILNNTWTDVGIQWIQQVPRVGSLDVYTVNGSAVQTRDTRGRDTSGANANAGKSVGAELQVTTLYPGLNVGLSYITGPHDPTSQLDSSRIGAHALLTLGSLQVQAEYLTGTDEGLGTVTTDRDVFGYYVVGSIQPSLPGIGTRLDVNLRYTDWTADDDAGNDFSETAVGVRLLVATNTWLKAEYEINHEDGTNPDVSNNRVGVQLSVLF